MNYLITAVGISFCCIGIILLMRPDVLRHIIEYLKQGNRMYYVALTRLVLGAMFLLGARLCKIPWVILVFGILMILKSMVAFVLGPTKLRPKIEKFAKMSHSVIRVLALLALVLGAVIVYSA